MGTKDREERGLGQISRAGRAGGRLGRTEGTAPELPAGQDATPSLLRIPETEVRVTQKGNTVTTWPSFYLLQC